MDDIWVELLKLWVLFYSSAAAFGSYIGTLGALGTFFGIRSLIRKRREAKRNGKD